VQLAMIGLGRMGANMVRRLTRGGHSVIGYDRDVKVAQALAAELQNTQPAASLQELVQKLTKPRIAWVMVPAGGPTESTVQQLADIFEAGDIIIDGGNSYFKDDARRAKELQARGIHYVDAGTSGGLWGLDRGYCLMVGGEPAVVQTIEPILKTLSPGTGDIEPSKGRKPGGTAEQGYLHCGPAGAGHFVKMVHNGIEYGLMQAYAEGFDIMKNAASEGLPEDIRYDINLADVAELWRRGSVVSSWLLDLSALALAEQPDLAGYEGYVQDSGEGRWTIQAALEEAVPAEVLSAALYTRFRSRQQHTFAEKLLSAMRFQFGGHTEKHTHG
jgi:6-phosphogluconate dehydrogenase